MKIIRKIPIVALLTLVTLFFSLGAKASETTDLSISTKIIEVHDGDTFTVQLDGENEKVRILGIDTPELSKTKPFHCNGKEIADYAKKKIEGKMVTLIRDTKSKNRDSFGRLLRYVEFEKKDFGAELIKKGFAKLYTKSLFTKKAKYNSLQKIAKKNKIGVWGDSCDETLHPSSEANINSDGALFTPKTPTKTCPSDKPIKGNISDKGEKIYHQPGGQYYAITIIGDKAGEGCLSNTSDAEKAGFRASTR